MNRKAIISVAMVLAFSAGVASHAWWSCQTPPASAGQPSSRHHDRPATPLGQLTQVADQSRVREPKIPVPRMLHLAPDTVSILLNSRSSSHDLTGILKKFGIADEEITTIRTIQQQALEGLKSIEKAHSQLISDKKGDYISISAFRPQHEQWLVDLEGRLRETLPDDRSAVLARIIASFDNDENAGLFRRELYLEDPPDNKGMFKIVERTFDERGLLIDTDYNMVTDQEDPRWNHLLKSTR